MCPKCGEGARGRQGWMGGLTAKVRSCRRAIDGRQGGVHRTAGVGRGKGADRKPGGQERGLWAGNTAGESQRAETSFVGVLRVASLRRLEKQQQVLEDETGMLGEGRFGDKVVHQGVSC